MGASVQRRLVACWMLLVALILVQSMTYALPCESSGYCSLGQVSPYIGNISASPALSEAAQQCSYKQEIIIMCSDVKTIDTFLQSSQQLNQLGLAHIMLLSHNQQECEAILDIAPDVGCVWSSDPVPSDMQDKFVLWNMRYRLAARLVRLGYNVLVMDSDMTIFDDPYKYFKVPPFKDAIMLVHHEHPTTTNSGLVYVQNAKPDGPAAFVLAEVANRAYRWADDDWKTAASLHLNKFCLYQEQDAFADILPDTASGYMLFPRTNFCTDRTWQEDPEQKSIYKKMWEHHREEDAFVDKVERLPDAWHTLAGGPTATIRSLQMRMPNCRGWPAELGGRWYPQERGPYSSAFLDQLHHDTPNATLWPDPEDLLLAAVADRIPHEKFAFMPLWIGIGWPSRGRPGYWDPKITGNIPQQVFAHTHYIGLYVSGRLAKRVVPMSLHVYNWTLAEKAHGENLYIACNSFTESCSKLRVLALTPAAEGLLAGCASWQELAVVLRGLAHLAGLLHRAVAWPSLPCNTSWITTKENKLGSPPLEVPEFWLPWTDGEDLMCTPWGYVSEGCLENGRGLLPWEWHHFLQQQQHAQRSHQHAQHPQQYAQQQSDSEAEHIQQHHEQELQHQHQLRHQMLRQHQVKLHADAGGSIAEAFPAVVLRIVLSNETYIPAGASQEVQAGMMQHVFAVDAESGIQDAQDLQNVSVVLLDDLVHLTYPANHLLEQQHIHLLSECVMLNDTAFSERFRPVQYSNADVSDEGFLASSSTDMDVQIVRTGRLQQLSHQAL